MRPSSLFCATIDPPRSRSRATYEGSPPIADAARPAEAAPGHVALAGGAPNKTAGNLWAAIARGVAMAHNGHDKSSGFSLILAKKSRDSSRIKVMRAQKRAQMSRTAFYNLKYRIPMAFLA